MRLRLLFLALLTAGCQPEARRLLVVDLTAGDPLLVESTAEPWHAAGYAVEYRRFYPHLTRHDLHHYRAVLVLGGREPERLSDALTLGDLSILSEWVQRGGAVVLAYASDEPEGGSLDRWVMNRWLASQGAGIAIGTTSLEAPAVPLPRSALDNAGFAPFPAGRSRALLVRDNSQALARADAKPLVAASRVHTGLVVVASRDLLAAGRLDRRTHDFLVALARWTRRPAEWAGVAAATKPAALSLVAAPQPVAVHPPPLEAPAGAAVLRLPQPSPRPSADTQPVVPAWISRQGMRVLWSRYAPYAVDSLLAFVDGAALNALATVIPVPALGDTLARGARDVWRLTAERLQATSLRWIPAVALVAITSEGADELDRHGDLVPVACGLDSLFWRGGMRPVLRALTRLGGARPELIAGVALDLDSAASYYASAGFCDADFRTGLAALGLQGEDLARVGTLPPPERYDTLLERGLLDRYYRALEDAVAERAVVLRGELRRLHPDVRFALRATRPPADWFSLGLMRGFATREAPVLLWTAEERIPVDVLQARYRERGIAALFAMRLDPARVPANQWPRLRAVVFGEHDGFWLERATSDSVGRLIRRLAK